MIRKFYKDEDGFNQWIDNNPNGFIYNDFGGSNPNDKKVHLVNCPFIPRMNTNVKKVCSSNLPDLIDWLRKNRGPEGDGYTPCKKCNPF